MNMFLNKYVRFTFGSCDKDIKRSTTTIVGPNDMVVELVSSC